MRGAKEVIVIVLLVSGVGIELFCCLGVVVMRDAYARLHYTAPAGLGALLLAVAVLVREGPSLIADKALGVAVFILLSAPVLAHITARAARIRSNGELALTEPTEKVE